MFGLLYYARHFPHPESGYRGKCDKSSVENLVMCKSLLLPLCSWRTSNVVINVIAFYLAA